MPTRTRTPDHVAVAGIDLPLVHVEVTGTELRQVAVPDGWPPYDCETHGVACPAAEQDASHQPAPPGAGGPGAGGSGAAGSDADAGARGAVAGGTPAPAAGDGRPGGHDRVAGPSAAWCGQFAQVLVEVLAGYRPAKQLARATTERVREQVNLLSCAVAGGERPRIRRVMTSRPAAGVVEMTMVASFGSRSRALAIRFEHVPARPPTPGRPARPARWLCTEIETPLAAGPVIVIAARRLRASSFGTFGHSPAATYGGRPPPGLRFMIMAGAACVLRRASGGSRFPGVVSRHSRHAAGYLSSVWVVIATRTDEKGGCAPPSKVIPTA